MLTDADYMARALFHAERGRGRTSPNPLVGAVIVAPGGVVVGHGYHQRAGEPHAEVDALDAAGDAARGATLYCTLEPCSHVGRTGPCVIRIVEAGIARVVAAVQDPNPLVAGRGFAYLREHGVPVEVGVGEREARAQNAGFFSALQRGRPLVIAKIATSIDARIAGPGGRRVSLTSAAASRRVHLLRASVDAVVVGSGTLLADDPLLTARGGFRERPLLRAVLDRRLRTPPGAKIFATLDAGPVIVLTSAAVREAEPERVRALEHVGAVVEAVAPAGEVAGSARAGVPSMARMLARLAGYGVSTILLEGGSEVHRAAWREGLIDRVYVVVTPHALGDAGVRWLDPDTLPWWVLGTARPTALGPDVWLEAHVHRTD